MQTSMSSLCGVTRARAQPPEERAGRERQIQTKNDVVCLHIAHCSCQYVCIFDVRLRLFSHVPARLLSFFYFTLYRTTHLILTMPRTLPFFKCWFTETAISHMSQILLSFPCRVHPVLDWRLCMAERAPQLIVVVLVRPILSPASRSSFLTSPQGTSCACYWCLCPRMAKNHILERR